MIQQIEWSPSNIFSYQGNITQLCFYAGPEQVRENICILCITNNFHNRRKIFAATELLAVPLSHPLLSSQSEQFSRGAPEEGQWGEISWAWGGQRCNASHQCPHHFSMYPKSGAPRSHMALPPTFVVGGMLTLLQPCSGASFLYVMEKWSTAKPSAFPTPTWKSEGGASRVWGLLENRQTGGVLLGMPTLQSSLAVTSSRRRK